MRLTLLTSVTVAVLAEGCSPTYAPMIRAAQYGAPARLEEGRVELGGAVGGFAYPMVVVPHLGIGVRDWLSIEGGGNFLIGGARDSWALGFVGPRFSFAPHRERRVHLIADLELGVGAGYGGEYEGNDPGPDCTRCDHRTALDRLAYGGYGGVGVGAQIAWFSIFARARVEASTASGIPTTLWPSASAGIEFNLRKVAAISFGGGYVGYTNANDSIHGWFYQIGVTGFIDAFARHDAVAVRPPPSAPTPPRPAPPPPPPVAPTCTGCETPDEPMPGDDADAEEGYEP